MQRQTAVDTLIDVGRDIVTAVGAERSRPATAGATGPTRSIAVGALLVLAASAAPILVVGVVGYVVTLARGSDSPGFGVGSWVAIATAGVRGTILVVGAVLPLGGALGAVGLLDVESGAIVLGPTPGPIVGVTVAALAVVTWHTAVIGITAVVGGQGWGVVAGIRFGRSRVGIRFSAALAGLAGAVGVVGFGLTAIPVVGPVLAAVCGGVGIVIAGRLMGRAVTDSNLRGGFESTEVDRLAVPTDSAAGIQRDVPADETVQFDGGTESEAVRPRATRRQPRRGRL